MEKTLKILGVLVLGLFILSSCSSDDAETVGVKAGELHCECHELNEQMEDIDDDLKDLEWDKESEREEIADLQDDLRDLGYDRQDLMNEIADLSHKSWDQQDGDDDRKDWLEDFREEVKDYIEDNCDDYKWYN